MSKASERQGQAVVMKQELLNEIKHWKDSSMSTMVELRTNLKKLKDSRCVARREIIETRMKLEMVLKEMEAEVDAQLQDILTTEENMIKLCLEKLFTQRKRLDVTESILKEPVVGFKLKRTIEEGKHQLLAIREALMKVKRRNISPSVEFQVSAELLAVLEKCVPLGSFQLKNNADICIAKEANPTDSDIFLTSSNIEDFDIENATCLNNLKLSDKSVRQVNGIHSDREINLTRNADKEKRRDEPFKRINHLGQKLSATSLTGNNGNTKHKSSAKAFTDKSNKSVRTINVSRCQSATVREIVERDSIKERVSTSAREDSRVSLFGMNSESEMKQGRKDITYINYSAFVSHEEQGPDRKVSTNFEDLREKPTVRYLDHDLVREITDLRDRESIEGNVSRLTNPLSTVSNQSTASLSSVTYKPSNLLSSGPLHINNSLTSTSKSFFTYRARFHTKKHPQETDICRLTGIAVLDNGQIVIADINHLHVMLFADDFTYLFSLDCPSPCGICVVSQNIIAVTLFHNKKILLLKVNAIHLERYGEINVPCPETLTAIAYRSNCYYVVCYKGDIHVLGEDGRQINAINTNVSEGSVRHMDVNEDGTRIYVSESDRIVCFDETGVSLWQYKGPDVVHKRFSPSGLVLYHERLFVADWGRHKIQELSLDGNHVRDVVVDNIECPYAIGLQGNGRQLLVTQSNWFKQEARSRTVKIFEIK